MTVTPRDASTVVLMRDRHPKQGGPEVLLVRRHRRADFAAGAYVFPGGVLEAEDASPLAQELSPRLSPGQAQAVMKAQEPAEKALGLIVAAIRETFEEVGVLLGRMADGQPWKPDGQQERLRAARGDMNRGTLNFLQWVKEQGIHLATEELVYFAHWITPEARPKRFDTRFFVAEVPSGVDVQTDGQEVFDHLWITPAEGVALRGSEEVRLMTPTVKNLELLAGFSTTAEALGALREAEVPTILPKIRITAEGVQRIYHPWDPEYESL